MKIDFLGKGMAIRFDKVPKLIYFNENGVGCGTVMLDGKTIKLLKSVDIHALTADEKSCHPLKYNIDFYNPKTRESEAIATGKSSNELSVSINIMGIEPLRSAINGIKGLTNDERIPEEIRKEYADNFLKTIKDKPISKA